MSARRHLMEALRCLGSAITEARDTGVPRRVVDRLKDIRYVLSRYRGCEPAWAAGRLEIEAHNMRRHRRHRLASRLDQCRSELLATFDEEPTDGERH